jgi:hypothetical protein
MKSLGRRSLNRALFATAAAAPVLSLGACEERSTSASAVYALVDSSRSYFREVDKVVRILRAAMGFMRAHDSFAVAEIGACSFADEAVILGFTAPDRPSERQRLVAAYAQKLTDYGARARPTSHTDIRGGLLQAAQHLSARQAALRTILLFSDLEEDLPPGCRREATLPASLRSMTVMAANVIRLPEDNREPSRYTRRVDAWRQAVEAAGARWTVLPDPNEAATLFRD